MEFRFVYITTKDKEQAREIGRVLVEEKLAACVNIIDSMESISMWEGEIKDVPEAILIAKTKASHVEKLTQRVEELHSYECPCVLTLPVLEGHPPYFQWLEEQLK
jgi:periplasmic divalent cation tolerance protein